MNRKNLISAAFFLLLLTATIVVIFQGNDMNTVVAAMQTLSPVYLVAAALTALFFTSAEGIMIWYLLGSLEGKNPLFSCIKYSFVGFFYSGITPSATGGQPMQLYYMQKEGHKVSDSSVVLMTVAVVYKLVLALMGVAILLFYRTQLMGYLGNYIYLYYLGLFLNTALVVILLFVMISPRCFKSLVLGGEAVLKKLHILKKSGKRKEKLIEMADQYHEAVVFLIGHKNKIAFVLILTFIQRCSVFFMTWLIYKGMGLTGESVLSIMILQASVYIAVDMLPLPGAQGITEIMYKASFGQVFKGALLPASMCLTRGLNFYFLLIVSAVTAMYCHFSVRRKGLKGSWRSEEAKS